MSSKALPVFTAQDILVLVAYHLAIDMSETLRNPGFTLYSPGQAPDPSKYELLWAIRRIMLVYLCKTGAYTKRGVEYFYRNYLSISPTPVDPRSTFESIGGPVRVCICQWGPAFFAHNTEGYIRRMKRLGCWDSFPAVPCYGCAPLNFSIHVGFIRALHNGITLLGQTLRINMLNNVLIRAYFLFFGGGMDDYQEPSYEDKLTISELLAMPLYNFLRAINGGKLSHGEEKMDIGLLLGALFTHYCCSTFLRSTNYCVIRDGLRSSRTCPIVGTSPGIKGIKTISDANWTASNTVQMLMTPSWRERILDLSIYRFVYLQGIMMEFERSRNELINLWCYGLEEIDAKLQSEHEARAIFKAHQRVLHRSKDLGRSKKKGKAGKRSVETAPKVEEQEEEEEEAEAEEEAPCVDPVLREYRAAIRGIPQDIPMSSTLLPHRAGSSTYILPTKLDGVFVAAQIVLSYILGRLYLAAGSIDDLKTLCLGVLRHLPTPTVPTGSTRQGAYASIQQKLCSNPLAAAVCSCSGCAGPSVILVDTLGFCSSHIWLAAFHHARHCLESDCCHFPNPPADQAAVSSWVRLVTAFHIPDFTTMNHYDSILTEVYDDALRSLVPTFGGMATQPNARRLMGVKQSRIRPVTSKCICTIEGVVGLRQERNIPGDTLADAIYIINQSNYLGGVIPLRNLLGFVRKTLNLSLKTIFRLE